MGRYEQMRAKLINHHELKWFWACIHWRKK